MRRHLVAINEDIAENLRGVERALLLEEEKDDPPADQTFIAGSSSEEDPGTTDYTAVAVPITELLTQAFLTTTVASKREAPEEPAQPLSPLYDG